ncbi:MAG: hypothetical protein IJR88_02285 [Clostridia bacterium]|nr:hypothetical protein [Clostridia bacterium]
MKNRILSLIALLLALLLLGSAFAACSKAANEKSEDPAPEEIPEIEEYDPDSVDAEGHELPKPTISVARISGDYEMSGKSIRDDFANDANDKTDEIFFSMNVFPSGENLSITVIPSNDSPSKQYTVTDYDPLTGRCSFSDENELPLTLVFSESDGKIIASILFDKTDEKGRTYGSYKGQKK